MPKVVITDYTFPDLSVEEKILKAAGATEVVGAQARTWEEVAKVAADADAVITQFAPVDAQAIAAMKKVKVISRYGIGVDSVDLKAAKARGIPVCNVPDYCIDEVADHTLSFILAITRQVVSNALPIRNGEWKAGVPVTMMRCLRDMTVGVVAFGRIGRAVVNRLVPFGCKILVFDPVASKDDIAQADATSATLDEILAQSDLITLHCPSIAQTRGMLNKAAFAKMKKGVLIVNASRGDLIVTDDLIEALRSGQVDSAALDVTSPEPPPVDSPLRAFPQVIIHAHIASVSVKSVRRLRESVAHHAARALRGEKPQKCRQRRMKIVSARELTDLVVTILEKSGVGAADARLTADVLVTTDTWGVATHGTKLLRGYGRRLRAGGLNPKGVPKVIAEGTSWALIDGDTALGMVTSVFATKVAIGKAKATGIAIANVRNSCHFGAAGSFYAHLAAQEKMISPRRRKRHALGCRARLQGPGLRQQSLCLRGARRRTSVRHARHGDRRGRGRKSLAVGRGGQSDSRGLAGRPGGTPHHRRRALSPTTPLSCRWPVFKGYGLALMIDVLAGVLSGRRHPRSGWRLGLPFRHPDEARARLHRHRPEDHQRQLRVVPVGHEPAHRRREGVPDRAR